MTGRHTLVSAFCLLALGTSPALADNLYRAGNWVALASDRHAEHVGDSLTVVVSENASATNSVGVTTAKTTAFTGNIQASSKFHPTVGVNLAGNYTGEGSTVRAGQFVTQLSVTVDRVLPNGDLHVSGSQSLTISGEHSLIKLSGRVRPADIGADNSIQSNRLADAIIEYDGKGYASRGAKPGLVARIFSFLGLM